MSALEGLPGADELQAAIDRADRGYLLEWIERYPRTLDEVRDGIRAFEDGIDP